MSLKQTPTKTGFVSRIANIKEADEYYLSEYSNAKFPKQQKQPIAINDARPEIAWKLKFNASICGKPVSINNGQALIVTTYDKQVFKLDTKTGAVKNVTRLWYQPIGNPLSYGGEVLIPQRNGNITAISQSTLKRTYNSRSAVHSKPKALDISISGIAINTDKIFVSKHWGNLYILRAKDGQMLMDPGIAYESRIPIPAVFSGSNVIFTNVAGDIFSFATNKNKQLIWKAKLPTGYATSMIIHRNHLYCITTEKELIAFDIKAQTWEWNTSILGYGFNSLSIHGNQLFVNAGNAYALDMATGAINWELSPSKDNAKGRDQSPWGFSRNTITKNYQDQSAYTLSHEGELTQFNPNTGQIQSQFKLNQNNQASYWNGLTKINNLLITSNDQKELIAIRTQPRELMSMNDGR